MRGRLGFEADFEECLVWHPEKRRAAKEPQLPTQAGNKAGEPESQPTHHPTSLEQSSSYVGLFCFLERGVSPEALAKGDDFFRWLGFEGYGRDRERSTGLIFTAKNANIYM